MTEKAELRPHIRYDGLICTAPGIYLVRLTDGNRFLYDLEFPGKNKSCWEELNSLHILDVLAAAADEIDKLRARFEALSADERVGHVGSVNSGFYPLIRQLDLEGRYREAVAKRSAAFEERRQALSPRREF